MGDDEEIVDSFAQDYATEAQMEAFMTQLREQEMEKSGPPPAAKTAIANLKYVEVDKRIMEDIEMCECSICKEDFILNQKVRQLPCGHLFHGECIVPWLSQHCSCPLCRFALPSDEDDKAAASDGNNNNTSTTS